MNERLKKLAEQAGLEEGCVHGDWTSLNWPDVRAEDLERFAELVRQDERDKCASDYLQDCCDAIAAAEHNEREAIAELVEADGRVHPKAPDFVWRQTIAKLIRARGKA